MSLFCLNVVPPFLSFSACVLCCVVFYVDLFCSVTKSAELFGLGGRSLRRGVLSVYVCAPVPKVGTGCTTGEVVRDMFVVC